MHQFIVYLLILALVSFTSVHSFRHIHPIAPKVARSMDLHMGGKQAKFGIFSPAVYAAKFVLGEAKLNKVSILGKKRVKHLSQQT